MADNLMVQSSILSMRPDLMYIKYVLTPILFLLVLFPVGCSSGGGGVINATNVSPGKIYKAKNGVSKHDIKVLLREHNRVRADVGVGKLTWSKKLGRYAQAWTDHLAATSCEMQHRPREGKWKQHHGENLFIGTAGFYSVREAVLAWESEKSDYRYGVFNGSSRKPIGHYTQVIWKNTTRVGCGQTLCNGNLIVACNYDPPGNWIGQKPY